MANTKFQTPTDKSPGSRIKSAIRPLYYWCKTRLTRLRGFLMGERVIDMKNIPIIINNYNRLEFPLRLIAALTQRGYHNIYIIDNASTYPPLLKYYEQCPYKVFRLEKNIGYLSLWKTDIYKQFINQYYAYTDPDVVMIDECPDDFMQYFYETLQRFPNSSKIGFSLKIDDLPDHFDKRQDVLDWEMQFWENKIGDGLFEAPIDTTFALYRPFVKWGANFYEKQIRTDYPYQVHHLPWYNDTDNLSDEEEYYIKNASTATHWTNNK